MEFLSICITLIILWLVVRLLAGQGFASFDIHFQLRCGEGPNAGGNTSTLENRKKNTRTKNFSCSASTSVCLKNDPKQTANLGATSADTKSTRKRTDKPRTTFADTRTPSDLTKQLVPSSDDVKTSPRCTKQATVSLFDWWKHPRGACLVVIPPDETHQQAGTFTNLRTPKDQVEIPAALLGAPEAAYSSSNIKCELESDVPEDGILTDDSNINVGVCQPCCDANGKYANPEDDLTSANYEDTEVAEAAANSNESDRLILEQERDNNTNATK